MYQYIDVTAKKSQYCMGERKIYVLWERWIYSTSCWPARLATDEPINELVPHPPNHSLDNISS